MTLLGEIMVKDDTIEKMNSILLFIKKFTQEYKYPPSVREICKGMAIKSTATVYYYLRLLEENGHIKKAQSKNRALEVITPYSESFPAKNNIDIPLVGRIAAGEPILATQNLDNVYSMPSDLFNVGGELFMLKVCGHSMIEAGIMNSDNIIIRKQSTADNGQIVVAMLDGNATVKRFFKEKDHYRLHPENEIMKDIIVKEVDILGIVVGLIRQM